MDTLLTNFTARIMAEVVNDDGSETTRLFEIEAGLGGRRRLFTVPAKEFARMDWVTRELGARAIVYPGYTIKDHARTAIQALSRVPEARTIYAHTGWRKVSGHWVYLHAAGAIGHKGVVPGVETNLSAAGLDRFALPEPPEGKALAEAVRASLRLQEVASLAVTVPLFAAIWRAAPRCKRPTSFTVPPGAKSSTTSRASFAVKAWASSALAVLDQDAGR